MRILVDMDGTLNLFDDNFIKWVYKFGYKFDTDSFYKEGNWDISKFIIGTDDPKKLMNTICTNQEFWLTIPVMPYAPSILKNINKDNEVLIVTAPWLDEDEFKESKLKWMQKYFSFIRRNQIIFMKDKWELEADIIIEDKPETIEKCNDKMVTICCSHPYNQNVVSDYRFKVWTEVPKIIRNVKISYRDYLKRGE